MPHADDVTSPKSEFDPSLYPPFPEDDTNFGKVKLETISLQKLLNDDDLEQARVFEACKAQGFFYLELAGCTLGETIHRGADEVARVSEQIFKLPLEEKSKYEYGGKTIFGYKCVGRTVVDKNATPDTAEFFNISKDFVLENPGAAEVYYPSVVQEQNKLFADYMTAAHTIGLRILVDVIKRLGADPEEITSRHQLRLPAGDHIRMTRGPPRVNPELPEIQTPSHTDFGSITVLMNWLGGLQVWSQSSRQLGSLEPDSAGEWLWVPPREGCAIINLGDAAVKFSNGVLCSGRHRVIPAPGTQGLWPRYSIVYFVRPNDDCILRTLKGRDIPQPDADAQEEGIPAKEWIFQQAMKLAGGKS